MVEMRDTAVAGGGRVWRVGSLDIFSIPPAILGPLAEYAEGPKMEEYVRSYGRG